MYRPRMMPPRDHSLPVFIAPRPTARVLQRAVAPLEADGIDALARAASAGQTEAMAALYDELVRPVYRYVALRVRHREDAEDLTQLVFERIVAGLPRYRHTGRPFQAWAFRIARNAVIDHRRRERSHEPLEATEHPGNDDEPDARALRDEALAELRHAMRRLTADQQEALALRFGGGLSADEAAAVMGRRAGTIRGLTFRAITTLRRHLADEEAKR
jgi:RNA polymerase sigma-70 factor (ECF subfamily)